MEAIPAGIAYLVDDIVQWANAAFSQCTRIAGPVQGRTINSLVSSDALQLLLPALQQAKDGTTVQLDWSEQTGAGAIVWITTTFAPDFDDHGKVRGVIMFCLDSSDRHAVTAALNRRDREYQMLIESVSHMVWTADRSGKEEFFNRHWRDYTGEHSPGTWMASLHPDDVKRATDAFADARMRKVELTIELRFKRFDSVYHRHLVRALPLLTTEQEVLRWYGTCLNIEDQKLAQQSLSEAQTKNNQFIATLSHELRNPVAALSASAQLLSHENLSLVAALSAVNAIQRQTDHLRYLVDALLDISTMAAGKIKLDRTILNVQEICREVCADFEARAEAHAIKVYCTFPSAPIYFKGDTLRIRQCVDNLVSNALNACSANDEVEISLVINEAWLEVRVRDTGIGIAAAKLKSIFEPFTQCNEWQDKGLGLGLGLGLSIVHTFAQLHDGTISVRSAGRHQGATFALRLPYDSHCVPASGARKFIDWITLNGQCKLLIVDDETDSAMSLKMLFELQGVIVEVAENGADALRMAAQFHPDAVLCDIRLPPPFTGHEVARRMRELTNKSIFLAAYSGFGSVEDVERSLQAGFDIHITKPSTLAFISNVLRRGIEEKATL